jgi:hypothetical protein
VLDAVDARLGRDPRAGEIAGVGGHLRAALVGRGDRGGTFGHAERSGVRVGTVEVELDEVRAVVELCSHGRDEVGGVLDLDSQTVRQ